MQQIPATYVIYGGTVTATTSTGVVTMPMSDVYTVVIEVSAASGTSPTLDVCWANSYDDGTTFQYMPLRSSQIVAVRSESFTIPQHTGFLAESTVVAATGGILTKNFVVSRYGRFTMTVGGTSPSFTMKIVAYTKSLGA